MAPGTEFARDFCAGIGPLQLGVVLVSIVIVGKKVKNDRSHAIDSPRITKVILKNCQKIGQMTHLTVKTHTQRRAAADRSRN